MTDAPHTAVPPTAARTCYRHPDRPAGVSCQRCGRPICPSCMIQASVGFHCPDCVSASARSAPVYDARNLPTQVPYVTYVLIGINVLVFLGDLATGGTLFAGQGRPYHEGALSAVLVAYGDWYRVITSGFLHYGIMHLGMNMLALYIIGSQLEKLLGPVRYLSLYVAALVAGSLGALVLTPNALTAGASGAIFGLFGAAAAYQLSNKIDIWRSGLGGLILLNLLITFSVPGISKGGHLGGLVMGGLVGWGMFELERREQSPWVGVAAAAGVALVCIIAAIALAPQLIVVRR